jgi:hypothetical protein
MISAKSFVTFIILIMLGSLIKSTLVIKGIWGIWNLDVEDRKKEHALKTQYPNQIIKNKEL